MDQRPGGPPWRGAVRCGRVGSGPPRPTGAAQVTWSIPWPASTMRSFLSFSCQCARAGLPSSSYFPCPSNSMTRHPSTRKSTRGLPSTHAIVYCSTGSRPIRCSRRRSRVSPGTLGQGAAQRGERAGPGGSSKRVDSGCCPRQVAGHRPGPGAGPHRPPPPPNRSPGPTGAHSPRRCAWGWSRASRRCPRPPIRERADRGRGSPGRAWAFRAARPWATRGRCSVVTWAPEAPRGRLPKYGLPRRPSAAPAGRVSG